MKFEELNLESNLMEGLEAMNFQEMTPIQEKSIPFILDGRDIIACAQTGTGKTTAYLLPLLNRMLKEEHSSESVNAIIMAPTRELAQQIDQQLEGFSYFLPITSVPVYGGSDAGAWEQQKKAMQLGADFVIATPGRLISHINLGYVDFSKVSYFVLDEADRMLDMGFYDDIIHIVKQLPKQRQTIMFSATMPPKIRTLANTILNNPVTVDIAISKPAEGIEQGAYVCFESQKLGLIQTLFEEKVPDKVIVFSSSKQKVRDITRSLKRMNLLAEEIHSDLEQARRDEALLAFRNGKINILVATDIVSRGI
ncbi:MAG: DEAD/DEAH box helicase, partial [Paludibacteraceae bacterium]|nr:DEAD/DEAH box helicase [Paludibacteraceae bacterium]